MPDIEFVEGRFTIAGTDRSIGIMELAEQAQTGLKLPSDLPQRSSVDHVFSCAPAYPNGCHIAEVEIDPATGVTEVVSYVMINDFGTLVNPMLVEGQLHGGVIQGIGQALMEHTGSTKRDNSSPDPIRTISLPRAAACPGSLHFREPSAADGQN